MPAGVSRIFAARRIQLFVVRKRSRALVFFRDVPCLPWFGYAALDESWLLSRSVGRFSDRAPLVSGYATSSDSRLEAVWTCLLLDGLLNHNKTTGEM